MTPKLRYVPLELGPLQDHPQTQIELYRSLWHELHTDIRTKEQFANWVKRVPAIGCECSSWLAKYLQDNPPTEDLREYGWTLHCAVSRKLEKPDFSWDDFCKMYTQVPSE